MQNVYYINDKMTKNLPEDSNSLNIKNQTWVSIKQV